MTDEKFYSITSWNNKKRVALQRVVAILTLYATILVSLWLHFEWWVRYDWACFIVSFLYILFLSSIGHETNGVEIFIDRHLRIQDFADYSEAPYFVNSVHNYYAPVRNGDFVTLSNNEYLKLYFHSYFIGKDVDFNSLYSMTVRLLDEDKVIYEIRRNGYDYRGALCDLYRGIKDRGLDIEAVYNKFGDLKWRKREQFKNKSKARECRLKILQAIWLILQVFVTVLPVAFMLYAK